MVKLNYDKQMQITVDKGALVATSATRAATITRGGFRCASFRPGPLFGQAGIEIGEAKSHAFCPMISFLRWRNLHF